MSDKKKFNNDELVVQNIMKDEKGRDYMWKKLQDCGVFENIFDNDSIQHAYNAGKRKSGLLLQQDLMDYTPEYYAKMIQEHI